MRFVCIIFLFNFKPTPMSTLQLLSIFLLLVKTSKIISQSLIADCQLVDGRSFQPALTTSLLDVHQFFASSSPVVADCAQICLQSGYCGTAVYEGNGKTCTMYTENAAYSGLLVINATGIFTTIILDNLNGKI